MKLNKNKIKELSKLYATIIIAIIIGASYTLSYYEIKELIGDYKSSMTIINTHFENKEINIEKSDGVEVEAHAQVKPSEEEGNNVATGNTSPPEEIGEFTAYSKGDGFTPGVIMASGKEIYQGAIACPIKYEFGTKIEVNKKIYICEDRMAKRFREGNYFDIYIDDIDKALKFGRRQLAYLIIKK